MSTTTTTRSKAPAALGHSITKRRTVEGRQERTVISITLNDECSNGHCDFSLTCSIYDESGNVGGGCARDHILELVPELAPFAALHLADFTGAPMHAPSNGYFLLHNLENTPEERDRITRGQMRCTAAELDTLKGAQSSGEFHVIAHELGLPAIWQKQATAAIKMLEKWSGGSFDLSGAGVSRYKAPTPEAIAEYYERQRSGYYEPEQMEARRAKTRAEAIQKRREKATSEAAAAIAKATKDAEDEKMIALAVLDTSPDMATNYIHYSHTNELRFNWRGYGRKVTQEELDDFIARVPAEALPEGITIGMHKGR